MCPGTRICSVEVFMARKHECILTRNATLKYFITAQRENKYYNTTTCHTRTERVVMHIFLIENYQKIKIPKRTILPNNNR